MTTLARHRLDSGPLDRAFWPAVAAASTGWLARAGVLARDAVVLLPHAALLPHARAAFASLGGWQPRIETPATLAASAGPRPPARVGDMCGEPATDKLNAAALLRGQSQGRALASRDPRAFDAAIAALLLTAGGLHLAAVAQAPAQVGRGLPLIDPPSPQARRFGAREETRDGQMDRLPL